MERYRITSVETEYGEEEPIPEEVIDILVRMYLPAILEEHYKEHPEDRPE